MQWTELHETTHCSYEAYCWILSGLALPVSNFRNALLYNQTKCIVRLQILQGYHIEVYFLVKGFEGDWIQVTQDARFVSSFIPYPFSERHIYPIATDSRAKLPIVPMSGTTYSMVWLLRFIASGNFLLDYHSPGKLLHTNFTFLSDLALYR